MRHYTTLLLLALAPLASSCGTVLGGGSSAVTVAHREASTFGSYYVLTIGIDTYEHYALLPSAKADANSVQTVLEEQYAYKVLPSVRSNATDVEIKHALASLNERLTTNDRLLIYFSGHGEQGSSGTRGYWLPANAEETPPPSHDAQATHWISREFVADQLRRVNATEILIIDDSCYSGRRSDSSNEVPPSDSGNATAVAATGIAADCAHADWPRPERAVRWLSAARDLAASGSDAKQPSLFTKYLLEVLRGNDNLMSGNELFERIREHMTAAREAQMPEYIEVSRANHKGGDFRFVPKTWSVDEMELRMGRVTVRAHTDRPDDGSDQTGERVARDKLIQRIVANGLRDVDAKSKPIRPDDRALLLCLSISLERGNQLTMTLVDRANGKRLAFNTQSLKADAGDGERIANNIRAAVLNLHGKAVTELHGKEISVDIVRRALIAQRTQSWDLSVALGRQAYLDFDGKGLLKDAGYSMRAAIDLNVTSWLLLGPVFGFDIVGSQSSRSSFIGDLKSGTHANNMLQGTTTLTSGIAMGRTTVRMPNGLILPFGYASVGVAYFFPHLSDEYFVPMTLSDTLPTNIINERSASSSAALVWEVGGGVAYRWTERLSVLAEAQFLQAYHNMMVASQINGFNQQNRFVAPFQGIHGVSIRVGVGLHY
jgi:hypothetical protein